MATHDAQGRELFVCSQCKCRRIADEFELDRHGHRRKGCKACKVRREAKKCPHKRQRHTCRECAGTSICGHNRLRQYCRECAGASVCEHGRRRQYCRECGGVSVCAHGRQRRYCRECDPAGHLHSLVSTRIRKALRDDKDRGSIEYLGCSLGEFKAHIETTFEPGMTWENHGKANVDGPRVWNIDHIVPIKFETVPGVPPTLEEVIERLHWTNTQALWAVDNIAKGNRFVGRALPAAAPPATAAPESLKLTNEDIDELLADLSVSH